MFLEQPGQLQGPPMRHLTGKEIAEHLWNGENSIAKRVLRAAAQPLAPGGPGNAIKSSAPDKLLSAIAKHSVGGAALSPVHCP